ncbi:vWA domain-containing protein [Bythopirellula polymerisocia]|uniref:von Willebrand factor type A domain protein n=1 Tax=Bythopirellula polymerisocia TaxID=2528003 RepID=A0A5C6CN71_9BACT|nr:VWA domain-containing protein [Bythopirellula polymerisocia]TWU25862.1 von Willebrand factor type A domain protein [Bythopirellula polymerisocia]
MFHNPWILALLLLLPVIAWRMWTGARQTAVPFSSIEHLQHLRPTWRQRLAWLPAALTLAAIAVTIIALARPREGREQTVVDADGIAIEMVVDRSGSMRALDFKIDGQHVDRLTAIKNVAGRFIGGDDKVQEEDGLTGRVSDLVGLVTFAGFADAVTPPTLDHAFVMAQLNHQDIVVKRAEDGTAIGDAISLAVEKLNSLDDRKEKKVKSKVLVLLTDGENNAGEVDPQQAAELAKKMDIKIYTIGVGTRGRAPVPVINPLSGREEIRWAEVNIDEDALRKIAATTGGKYFRATNTESLTEIYREIDQLEKTKIEEQRFVDYRELAVQSIPLGTLSFPPLVLVALGLLSARVLLSNTLFREFA